MRFPDFWFALHSKVHSLFIQANLKSFPKILLGTTLLYLISLRLLLLTLSCAAVAVAAASSHCSIPVCL